MMKNLLMLVFCLYGTLSCGQTRTRSGVVSNDSLSINQTPEVSVLKTALHSDLPDDLLSYINTNLIGYAFPVITGELSDNENSILEFSPTPFSAHSDFNGDGKDDYVLVLLNTEQQIEVIAFNSKGKSYKPYHIEIPDRLKKYNNSIKIILSVAEKGAYSNEAEEEKIYPNDFFLMNDWDESLTTTYWWNGETYDGEKN